LRVKSNVSGEFVGPRLVIVAYNAFLPEQGKPSHHKNDDQYDQKHVEKAVARKTNGRNCVQVVRVSHVLAQLPLHGLVRVAICHQVLLL